MKIFTFFLLLFSLCSFDSKKESSFIANSFIVIENQTNTIIDGVNYYKTQSVASISKIMTGIIAIERLDLTKKVYIDDCIDKAYGSAVYLKKGTWISNKDLIYGLLLRSGNDCALMIAKSVAGNLESFINIMNSKAKELGMNKTSFTNPHGLDEVDEGNISCCYDMALLQSYAMQNELYRTITSTKEYKSEGYGIWYNKNKLLTQYDKCISGKTGYTKKAKRTLVTTAKNNYLELTIVTLNCGSDFLYHKKLYQKHFEKYDRVLLLKKGEYYHNKYTILIDKDIYYFANKEDIEVSKILIKIDESKKICTVYIVGKSTENIGTFTIEETNEKKSFFSILFKTFKYFIFNLFEKETIL